VASGQYAAAQSVLQTYVHAYPKDKALRAELAKVAVKNAQQQLHTSPETAAAAARTAVWADPSNQPAKEILAQSLKNVGVNSQSASDRLKLADNLLAQGKPTDAEVEYEEALKLKPSAEGHVGLGDASLRQGKKDKAKAEYQRALEINPNSAVALRQMGSLRYQQGEVIGANTDLSRALVLNPKDSAASKQLIDLWQHQVAHSPNAVNGHLGLARAYQLSGDLKSAQGEYRQVVRIDPQNPNLPAARQSFKLALARQEGERAVDAAHTLENQGLLNDAHSKALEAVGLCPGNVSMRLYQAQLSQKMGSYNEAHDAYMDVLRVDPKNEEAAAGLKSLPPMTAPQVVNNDPPPLAPPIIGTPSNAMATGLSATAGSLAPLLAPNAMPGASAAPFSLGAPQAAAAAAPVVTQLSGGAPVAPVISAYAKPYDTTPHVNTLSGFLGQIRGLAAAQQASSMATEAGSHSSGLGIGALAGFGGSGTAAAAAASSASTVQALANEATPNVDASDLQSTLAKANAALKAAGVNPSAAAPAPSTAAPSLGPGTAAPSAVPASVLPGDATGGPASLLGFAGSFGNGLSQIGTGMNAVNSNSALGQLAAKYAPYLQTAGGQPLSSDQINSLYQQYRPQLQQQLGRPLPTNLGGPAETAQASATSPAAQTVATAPQAMATSAVAAVPVAAAMPVVSSVSSPDELQVAYQRMGSLEQQNQQLKDQLAQLQSLRTNQGAEPPNVVPMPIPIGQTGGTSAPETTAIASLVPSASGATSQGASPPPLPALVNTVNATSQAVKLELIGVQPTPLDIRLKVVLRNAQNVPINVPSGTKAIVLMNGKQRIAKVSFPSSSVPANGHLQGVIKVAGHDLNPSADLWLPEFLPGTGTERDLHLTVPISSLPLTGIINPPGVSRQ